MVNVFVDNAEKDSTRSWIWKNILAKIINLFSLTKQKLTVQMQACNLC